MPEKLSGHSPLEFPLTLGQRRIWSLAQIGSDDVMSPYALSLRVRGHLDVDALTRAIRLLGERHGALRMRFLRSAGGRIDQKIDGMATLAPKYMDLGAIDAERRVAEATRLALADASFDLADGLPTRALLLRLAHDDHLFSMTIHPIVCDAASIRVIACDLMELYSALLQCRTPNLPALDDDLTAALVEQAWLRSEACRTALNFWRDRLPAEPPSLAFPTRHLGGRAPTGERGVRGFKLGAESSASLRRLRVGAQQPMSTLLLTAFNALLGRYGEQVAFALGVVVENRADSARQGAVGRLEDVAPLLTRLTTDMTFLEALERVAAALDEAAAHHVPFERLAQEISDRDGESGKTFIQALCEHRRPVIDFEHLKGGVEIEVIDAGGSRADADIVFRTSENADGAIDVSIGFSGDLFDSGMIERTLDHFAKIIAAVTVDPGIALRDIALFDAEELDRLSAPYEDAASDDERPIHEIIGAQAQRQPDAPAVYHGDSCLTYGQLERSANQLAHRLLAIGAGPEVCVGIALRRSPQAIVAILAALKAGAAFVPIDPDHPAARNRHILNDAGISIVLTQSALRASISDVVDAVVLEIDRIDLDREPHLAPAGDIAPDQLAYVIYTSGSTGLPKGVAVEHGPLTRHCQSTARIYEMDAESCELAFLPFSSDGGHERWMTPLMVGGSVVLPDRLWTPEETFAAMRRHGVNNASFPTAYLQQLAEWAAAIGSAPPLRLYSFGGEGLAQKTFDLLSGALKAEWLINGYGPTETIMTPMVWKVRSGARFDGTYAPIGRAVGRRRVYILDKDLNPAPIGVTGELYIGGDGVARGYVGNPELTAERFVRDPFSEANERLYRSGDLARWREDGSVEFIGRRDHQVKLRGYRIELGEIEAALRAEPHVSECAAMLRADGGHPPQLVGYVVPAEGMRLSPTELRKSLARQLPEYMTPSAIVVLDRLPLNANAKVDRAALPSPASSPADLVAPATKREEELAAIWRDILGLSEIGVTQNFFEIGGHSLAALRILARVKLMNPSSDIGIADLFNHQDIRSLAPVIDRMRERTPEAEIVRLRSHGAKPMLYCFPGLLVSTREYMRLVDYLGPDQPATGFLCYSLSEDKKIDASVEEITARYAERIRSESKGQPCFFLGWSWGGLLAYEAARMLKDDIDLRMIGMVDVCDMDTDFAVGAIPKFDPGERDDLQRRIAIWLGETRMRADWDRLLSSMDAQAYDQFLRYVGNSEEDLPVDGPDIGSREHTFWVLIDNALIFRRYHMAPFDCPIHSWAAEDSLNRGLNLIDWRSLSRDARAAEIVSGTTHLHIIGATAFHARLALRMEEALDFSRSGSPLGGAGEFHQRLGDRRL
ncbi:non-ribosomal peptide synthetase [Methylocapsa aurea]|uniref:non-ribosomal peptide synthetase n=1 Tax=Methylocapsa aurea TaxID=663610 RepID=UPI000A065523|nr:non-ribosomal peptide synthetase [Methylocapsa aurea]